MIAGEFVLLGLLALIGLMVYRGNKNEGNSRTPVRKEWLIRLELSENHGISSHDAFMIMDNSFVYEWSDGDSDNLVDVHHSFNGQYIAASGTRQNVIQFWFPVPAAFHFTQIPNGEFGRVVFSDGVSFDVTRWDITSERVRT